MENFYENLEYNYQKIIEISAETSGTHSVNINLSERWVESQLSTRRRHAARNLLNSVKYITLDETINYINKLIDDHYENISSNDVYIFLNDSHKYKSNYFINILGIHRIVERGFKKPIIIESIEDNFQLLVENHLLVLDDMMYSGSQMNSFLEQLTFYGLMEEKIINVSVFVVGSTEYAIKRNRKIKLGFRSIKKLANKNGMKFDDIPMFGDNIHIIKTGFVEKNIYDSISVDEYLDILYYFSPFTYGSPNCCVYFDHKIADLVSTFLSVLLYGPILPSSLEYDKIEHTDLIYTSFIENINLPMSHYSIDKANSIDFINDHIKSIECEENFININSTLSFCPFINNIDTDTVDNSVFVDLPYYLFCMNSICLSNMYGIENYGLNEDPEDFNNNDNDYGDNTILYPIILYSKNIKNIYDNEARSKLTWYKDIVFRY